MILLVGAALLIKSLVLLQHVDPGFEADKVMGLQLHPPQASYNAARRYDFYEKLQDRLAELDPIDCYRDEDR